MTNPISPPPSSSGQPVTNPTSGRASYRPRHSSPSGKVSWPEPAPGVAGPDQRRGALVREAATEGGPQPEEKQPPRRQRAAPRSSRKRSPKPPSNKRSHVCSVRLNDDEKTLLSSAAAAARTTLPAFLARSGMAAAHDLDNTAAAIAGHRETVSELFAARRDLGRVGNNLNQITRAINSGGQPEELDVVLAAVRRAVDRVQAATDRLLNQP
ncbi:MobC family plasmid mobilization relaxosome protein [Streptomyces sp. 4.24]|uniref:MobC family plasmid mobilization relaxosome protein n=1 Tax=Streptomyces tritrimontium TaxID=3406573 RepID=UPI003BB70C03